MTRSWKVLLPAALLCAAASGCNCGNPTPAHDDGGGGDAGLGGDAGGNCGADTCGPCLPSCSAADVCHVDGTWSCSCVCTEPDGGPTPDGGFDIYAFCQAIAAQECDFMIRCHSDDNTSGFNATEGRGANDKVAPSQRAACVTRLGSDPGCLVVAESWVKGRTRLDTQKYLDCVDAFHPTTTCDRDLNSALQKCVGSQPITPLTASGQPCAFDQECINGWCGGGSVACGACQPYVPVGSGAASLCFKDAMCDPATSYCPGPDGTAAHCTAYTPVNGACNVLDLEFEECGPGKVCAKGVGGFGCALGKAVGTACTKNNFECARSPHSPYPENTCATVAVDGGSMDICQPIQTSLGGPCNNGDFVSFAGQTLVFGQVCHEAEVCPSHQCIPRKTSGLCGVDAECAAGEYCLVTTGVGACVAFADNGQACTSQADGGNDCLNLLTCSTAHLCQPELAALGQACGGAANTPCQEGFCAPDAGLCEPLQPPGAPCTSGAQCDSFICAPDGGCQPACWK